MGGSGGKVPWWGGYFVALTLTLFLQVIINLLSSSSPQRVRWMVTVLSHLVQGPGAPSWPGEEQVSENSGPDPGKPHYLACASVSPSVQWEQDCLGLHSQPFQSERSSTYWLCGLVQIHLAFSAQKSCL